VTVIAIRPLSERIKNIKLVDDDDGFLTDFEKARLNRENIERMRKAEDEHHGGNGLRILSLLDKPNEIKIKKEIEKEMETVTTQQPAKVEGIKSTVKEILTVEKSPGQLFYEKHAQEEGLKSPWASLAQDNKNKYERKALGTEAIQPHRPYTGRDWEKEKDAVLKDYRNLKLHDFYAKWKLNSSRWLKLKKQWGVKGKGHYSHGKPAVTKPETKEPKSETKAPVNNPPAHETQELFKFSCVMRASTASKLITIGIAALADKYADGLQEVRRIN